MVTRATKYTISKSTRTNTTEEPDKRMKEPEVHRGGCALIKEHKGSQNKGNLHALDPAGMQRVGEGRSSGSATD